MGTKAKPFRGLPGQTLSLNTTVFKAAAVVITASLVASCASAPPKKGHGKEYFPESKYGVKASPRVVEQGKPVPQGGGRYMVGKAYTVKGRVYTPAHDPDYESVGYASWYGSAFHGRRTANGEIYDMDMLSAAHPTMPLPSYARVTNLTNGSSVVVRVNDRGPFERDRVIDLSSMTAELLHVKGHGTAKVKVEYVGPARMEGHDKQMLMATYVPPVGAEPAPASNTMFAFRAPAATPTVAVALAAMPVPRIRPDATVDGAIPFDPYHFEVAASQQAGATTTTVADATTGGTTYGEQTLGSFIAAQPVAFSSDETLATPTYAPTLVASARSSYADDQQLTPAQEAANVLATTPQRSELQQALQAAIAREAAERHADATVIQVGVFSDAGNAAAVIDRLAALGRVTGQSIEVDGRAMQSVQLVVTDSSKDQDTVIAAVAAAGAPGAYIIAR